MSPRPALVGLHRERQVLTVAIEAGRHVVIEGPPGTGKSTLLRDIARTAGRKVVFAEGNAELTPARLVGQYDPAQVLTQGYVPDSFTDGPLLQAMRDGALLYLEEFNRIPEETLNVLITVLAEGEITVPRIGQVAAHPGFRLIAAMNPFDAVGTARVSQAVADRICRVVLGYQDAAAEREITTAATGVDGEAVHFAVRLTRATREHPDVRMGASVRGAIDLVLLLAGLARLRGESGLRPATARDAAYAALSGRIAIADGCDRSPESVLDELLGELWNASAEAPVDGTGGAGGVGEGCGVVEVGGDGAGEVDGDSGVDGGGVDGGSDGDVADGGGEAGGTDGGGTDGDDEVDGDGDGGGGGDGRGKARGRPGGAAAGRQVRSTSRSSLRRDRGRGGARRTAGRAELAARHAAFADVSPGVGRLDQDALARLLADDPDAAATLLADLALATDQELALAARRLAGRVFVRLADFGTRSARGTRRLSVGTVQDGDLDLDLTLDRLSGGWPPAADELVTRTWRARDRSLCLLIDTSGSMSGLAVAIAAVAAASVLLAGGGRLDPAVVAFGREATVLRPVGAARRPADLVGELIGLRGHGLTDLAGGLRAAARELAGPAGGGPAGGGPAQRGPAQRGSARGGSARGGSARGGSARGGSARGGERVAVLLSDCLATTGGDPAAALAGIDRLHVLCPLVGAESRPERERAAAALAGRRGGTSHPVRGLADVAPALSLALSL